MASDAVSSIVSKTAAMSFSLLIRHFSSTSVHVRLPFTIGLAVAPAKQDVLPFRRAASRRPCRATLQRQKGRLPPARKALRDRPRPPRRASCRFHPSRSTPSH